MPADFDILGKFILSLLLGGLIGMEREKNIAASAKSDAKRPTGFGGIRTYMLIALLGALSSWLGQTFSSVYYYLGFVIFGLLLAQSYYYYSVKLQRAGMTSEIGALITYLIGVSTFGPDTRISIVLGILVTLLFSLKEYLHAFVYSLHKEEFFATIKFAIIAFIVLPYLPKEPFDVWKIISFYKIWFFVVVISGISFLGYIFDKAMGPKKGFLWTGFIGGVISSTSVISSLSKRFKSEKLDLGSVIPACLLSYTASIVKVGLEISIINRGFFVYIFKPLAITVLTGLIVTFFTYKKRLSKKAVAPVHHSVHYHNPFTLRFAISFGIVLTAVFFMSQLAMITLGNGGIFITSFLAGVAKIDAVAVSMSELAGKNVTYFYAALAILLGFFFSAASKIVYSLIFGGRQISLRLLPGMLLIALSGLGALALFA